MAPRRMRHYPGLHDRSKWAAEQSDVPSQQTPVPDPYDPRYQIDEQQQHDQRQSLDWSNAQAAAVGGIAGTDGSNPNAQSAGAQCTAPAVNSYVNYGFETRPPLAMDFAGPLVNSNTASQETFTVPQGYICILKELVYGGVPVGGSTVDMFGIPNNTHFLRVTINGVPVPGYSGVDVSNGAITGFEMECFILARSGDVIKAQVIRGFPGVVTYSAVPGGVGFYGTLLSDDGRDISLQVGSAYASPVDLCSGSIAAIRPNPMVLPGPDGTPQVIPNPPKPGMANCPLPPAVSVNDYLACVIARGSALNNP